MAFSKSPSQDTYSSERVRLFRDVSLRDGGQSGKDEDYINIVIEPVKDKETGDKRHFIFKRAGASLVQASPQASDVRGMFYWVGQHYLFFAVNNDIYAYNVDTAILSILNDVFATTTGTVGMCEYLYDTGETVVCATDGTTLLQISDTLITTTCVDADLPTPHVPTPVFIDGYLFLVKQNSADIYNSDLNDPLAWTPGDFITAEMDGDQLIQIAKLNNYLVAFGYRTIEYFWDAAVASGSPLQRNDTPIKINTFLAGFAQYGNEIFYIGSADGGQPDVFKLQDFKLESLGNPSVTRYLNGNSDGFTNWSGNIVSFQGHTFYVLYAGTTKTWVLDCETKIWTRWAWKGTEYFPMNFSAGGTDGEVIPAFFSLKDGTSNIYKFDETLYQDAGTNFTALVTTENNDFGTMNRKTMGRASIIGDRPPTDTDILVRWSDDDYRTFNTGLTTNMNQDLPSVKRLGSFRQRVFKLSMTANSPWRIQDFEVDINKGTA